MTAQRKGSPPDMTCPSLTAGQIPAALATLCALGLAMVSACAEARPTSTPVRSERNPLESLTEVFSTQEAVDFIGLPFPSGATELHVAGVAALDTMVIARFDAPRQEVVSWLAELGITTPLEPGHSPFYSAVPPLHQASSWWGPPTVGATSGDFSGVYQQVGPTHFNVVLEEVGNGIVTVHFQVFNT